MKRKKGFTLVELIIVLAIIGIMTAILVPSWMTYIRKTRTRTADSRAKIIFNAAQTAAIKYQSVERTNTAKYMGDGDFYFCYKNGKGYKMDAAGEEVSSPENARFAATISKLLGEEGIYTLHINNYKVMSVYYLQSPNYRYPGTYPVTMLNLSRNNPSVADSPMPSTPSAFSPFELNPNNTDEGGESEGGEPEGEESES